MVSINAQDVVEEENSMSLGRQNSFRVTVEGADKGLIEDEWKRYVKEYGKYKKNKKAKEFYMLDAVVPYINGTNPINLYSKIEERKDQTTLYVWVDLKGGFAVSDEYPKESDNITNFMYDFWVIARKKVISEELKDAEKLLEKRNKEMSKLEKKNKNLHNDIEKYNEKIRKAEMDIEENLRQQDDKRVEIEEQTKSVEEIIERLNNVGRND